MSSARAPSGIDSSALLSSLSATNRLNGPKDSTSFVCELRRSSFIRVVRAIMSAFGNPCTAEGQPRILARNQHRFNARRPREAANCGASADRGYGHRGYGDSALNFEVAPLGRHRRVDLTASFFPDSVDFTFRSTQPMPC